MDLEKIIEIAERLAKPYRIVSAVLAVLLLISMLINAYLFTNSVSITLEADSNSMSEINQHNKG
jgi:hypothetical protein